MKLKTHARQSLLFAFSKDGTFLTILLMKFQITESTQYCNDFLLHLASGNNPQMVELVV